MRQLLAITALLLGCISMWAQTKCNDMKYNKIQIEDCRVFYREAGNPEKPTILLLHGFPSSSHMFRELMPELADEYHLIAPISLPLDRRNLQLVSHSLIRLTIWLASSISLPRLSD